jgi:hypothetical protein
VRTELPWTTSREGVLFKIPTSPSLTFLGRTLDELVGYTPSGEDRPAIVLVKSRGMRWQRRFFDAGLAFWEEWDEAAVAADFP